MEQQTTTKRIWEIDFLRGLLIPGMILIHLVYDVTVLYRLADWPWPRWYVLLQYNYGALFVALSGVSVTLGSRCVRRGLTVLAWGMVCTAVTAGMYLLGMADRGVLIYFGVLHCIGVCMLLWPVFRRCRCGAWHLSGLPWLWRGNICATRLLTCRIWWCWDSSFRDFPPRTIIPCCPIWAISCWAPP